MGLATKVFNYGICNAECDVLLEYLKKKSESISNIVESSDFLLLEDFATASEIKESVFYQKNEYFFDKDLYTKLLTQQLGSHYIKHISIYNELFNSPIYFNTYILLLQSLRLYALLHDLGHPPYSHITEFAISAVYNQTKAEKSPNLDAIKTFVGYCSSAKDNDPHIYSELDKILDLGKNDKSKMQIHEVVGKMLSFLIISNLSFPYRKKIRENGIEASKDDFNKLLNIQILLDLIKEIYKKKDFASISDIIDGKLDVDRIDYVIRDGHSVGIQSSCDVDRILKLFCLSRVFSEEIRNGNDDFAFYPSIQSLNDINELFDTRFRLYKSVVGHHKVKRYDYILQKIIELTIIHEIKNRKKQGLTSHFQDLTNLIEVMDMLAKNIKSAMTNEDKNRHFSFMFLQLTDSWLLSLLQGMLIKCEKDHEVYGPQLRDLLLEFFNTTSDIKSLWKRDFEYLDFCKKTGNHLREEIKKSISKNYEEETSEDFNLFIEGLKKIIADRFYEKSESHEKELVLDLDEINDTDLGIEIINYLILNAQGWLDDFSMDHLNKKQIVLSCKAKLKPPDSGMILVDNKKTSRKYVYEEATDLPTFLKKEARKSIQFFIFYKNSNKEEEETEKKHIKKELLEKITTLFMTKTKPQEASNVQRV